MWKYLKMIKSNSEKKKLGVILFIEEIVLALQLKKRRQKQNTSPVNI